MIMTAHETPQVTVSINDVPSKCTGICTFEWLPGRTPIVHNVTRVEGISHTIQISGTGFSNIPRNNNVTINGINCDVTEANQSMIKCDIDNVPSGEHRVVVNVIGRGLSKYKNGNLTISFDTKIDNINPTTSGMGGSVKLTITGGGFNSNSSVKVGAETCDLQTVTTNNSVCLVPSSGTAGEMPITVEQKGALHVKAGSNFTYDESRTPRVIGISPNATTVSGGNTLTINGNGFKSGENLTLLIGGTESNITFYNDTYVMAELPPCFPGTHQVRVIAGDNGAGMTMENDLPSITCILELTGVSPRSGSLFGGTSLTLEGQGFTSETKVKVGNHDCDVKIENDSLIICKIAKTCTIHRVNNHGIHPLFGKYYYWSPQHVQVMVGDIVRWDWDFPFYITTMKPKIEETFNMTAKYGKPGGFSSGVSTATGSYSREFSKVGKYYYWSGIIDVYGSTWFHGSVEVLNRSSYFAVVNVTDGQFEATHNVKDSMSVSAVTECCDTTEGRHNCSDSLPADAFKSTKFQFAFWTCRTPIIYNISRQNGTTNDKIVIEGDGFSGKNESNNVTFGDYICKVSSSSVSSISCSIDPNNRPRIGRAQYLDFLVNSLGYAHVNVEADISKTFALFPVINHMFPMKGSCGGYTRLTIFGTGFEDKKESIETEVNIGGYPCDIVSTSYTEIICLTPRNSKGQQEISIIIPVSGNSRIPAECDTPCRFVYDESLTPTITDVSPKSITGENTTTVTIIGTGFGDNQTSVSVIMTSSEQHSCLVTYVAESKITCLLTNLPLGPNKVVVHVSHKGRGLHINGSAFIRGIASVQKLSPNKGSKHGGTAVTVTGNGFHSNVTVHIDGSPCFVQHKTVSSLVFITEHHMIGNATLTIHSNGVAYPVQAFEFSADASPGIKKIHPLFGTSGENIIISGYNLGKTINHTSVYVGEEICAISAINESVINCTVGNNRVGTYAVHVNVYGLGNSNADKTFTFDMSVNEIKPKSGSLGGDQRVTILGAGFDKDMVVTICDRICQMSDNNTTDPGEYVCHTPSFLDYSLKKCSVNVTINKVTKTLPNAYTYDPAQTPVIHDVTPKRGGTQGGTFITISGSNFGPKMNTTAGCGSSVTIAGTLCNITFWSNIQVVCVTEAHSRSERTFVRLETGCNGKAKENKARFHFVDMWSSVYTWGGKAYGLPTAGDIVVIPKGQTILFDTHTPILKMLVIKGELVFDETDVELKAENILITDGGLLQVGTEDEPFQHKAIITLYGHHRSKELPIYGTKSLAVRMGTLDLHGKPTDITWTKLASSAYVGNTTIVLQQKVNWQVNDIIMIATTGGMHSYSESEIFTISSIATDNKTITLNNPLHNTHVGISEHVAGWELDFSAEVGLLTRNVVVRGRSDPKWKTNVETCPDGFESGNFGIQTCTQGRYGHEMGSDQFGAQVIIHKSDPTNTITTSRIEFVEFSHVGQAFRLGRYPINFHVTGDMSKSYVRGCGIHDTFNRAINIKDTSNLLIEKNVIYNVKGGAIFLEEGTETGNVFQSNLVVFVKGSSQLLNDDISPASFWITNPNNTFRDNVAAGGTHFGYRFYLKDSVTSSISGSHTPRNTPLAEFNNNIAHSLGWDGLFMHPIYRPRTISVSPSYSIKNAAVIENMRVWNCRKGIQVENMGSVKIRGLAAVNNNDAGYEGKFIVGQNYNTDDSPILEDSIIAGYLPVFQTQGYTKGGVLSPYGFGFTIRNVSFINFDKPDCSALTITKIPKECDYLRGGYMYKTQKLTFINVGNRVKNNWIWESVYEDMDGSLCGSPSCKVVPCTGTLPTTCTLFSNSSNILLCSCPVDVKLFRFTISPRSHVPTAIVFTNEYGSTKHSLCASSIDQSSGWMTNFVSCSSYTWNSDISPQVTYFSYRGHSYRMQHRDYVIISHTLGGDLHKFAMDHKHIPPSNETLDPETHYHGDWQYNETTRVLTYLISYRQRNNPADHSIKDIYFQLDITTCLYKGCVTPSTLQPTIPQSVASSYIYWSAPTSWPNNTLPVDDDDVTINKGTWMLVDTIIPRLTKLIIFGVLEFDHAAVNNSNRNFTLSVTDIIIIGGRLLIGSPSSPFLGKLDIELRGRQPEHMEEYLPSTQIPINSKTLRVYGALEIHGKDVGVTWTKLITTGNPGDTAVHLAENVTWEVGGEIVISPTSYDISEAETFRIMDVSEDGQTLSLNASLQFRHIAHSETINGKRVNMAAEVGLLTRNIRVFGKDEDNLYTERYGGRIYVGATMYGKEYYAGFARLSNVEFVNTGQQNRRPYRYYRFSLEYENAKAVTDSTPPSVRKCTFHHLFSSAISVHGTSGVRLEENIIYHSVSSAIETTSSRTTIQRNLIVHVIDYTNGFGAISGMTSQELTLKDNTVSGTSGVAFHVQGVDCGLTSRRSPSGNEAHTSSVGLAVFPGDNIPGSCFQISNYFFWKCQDIGIYYNNKLSVHIKDSILAENSLGIYTQVFGPSSVGHLYSPKHCTIKDIVIIGTTSSYNCSTDQIRSTGIMSHTNGSHVGMVFTSFMQGSNGAPSYSWVGIRTYPAIMGITHVHSVTFAHFKTACDTKDIMLSTNKVNDDGQHPVTTRDITKYDSETDSYFFIHRPNIEKINAGDCVDMDCDGLKKALITDEDGSFLGAKGSVISESEWEWDGDPRRGLGDYRIPREMLTSLSGERINVSSIAQHRGIIRNEHCKYKEAWQAYECYNLDYEMLIIESLDADTETRRLSPVAILGDCYLDLINGPQDHSGCTYGNCRKRLSTFMAIVASGKSYSLYFSTTSPQTLRLFLLNSDERGAITIGIWYSQSNRRDVYLGNDPVLAKNARMVNGKYIVDRPLTPNQYVPDENSDDVTGTNFFDRDSNILYVLIRGSRPVKIVTNPSFIVSFQIPALTPEEFYGESLVHNLALFFDVPPEKIRVVNVVRESGRKRRNSEGTVNVKVEIADPPAISGGGNETLLNETSTDKLTAPALLNMSSKFINEVQGGGDISKVLNFTVTHIAVSEPVIDTREDAHRADSSGEITVPKTLKTSLQLVPSYETVPFAKQPCLHVFDIHDEPMKKIGSIGDPWQITAYLQAGIPKSAKLQGTTTVAIIGGWANFTDLALSHYGNNFSIQFNKTYPDNKILLSSWSHNFSISRITISPRINASVEIILNNDTDIRIELIDDVTQHRIKNISWRGHIWTASINLNESFVTHGNKAGFRNITFNPSTGEAIFNSFAFHKIGTFFLTFNVTSFPEEYNLHKQLRVRVMNQKQLDLRHDNETVGRNISLTFNESYVDTVGNNEQMFGDEICNIIARQYPDVYFDEVEVKPGSIIVEATIHGRSDDINSTLQNLTYFVQTTNFSVNGKQLRRPVLRTNVNRSNDFTSAKPRSTESASVSDTTSSTIGNVTNAITTPKTIQGNSRSTISTETTTPLSTNAELSFPLVIAIVITPVAVLLGVIFIVIICKCNRIRKQEQLSEYLTRTSTIASDDIIERKDVPKGNEYAYMSPFPIDSDMKSSKVHIPRIQNNAFKRPFTPTYEIENHLPPSSAGSIRSTMAMTEDYRRRLY